MLENKVVDSMGKKRNSTTVGGRTDQVGYIQLTWETLRGQKETMKLFVD